jgi:hypothetical protein
LPRPNAFAGCCDIEPVRRCPVHAKFIAPGCGSSLSNEQHCGTATA